MPSGKDDDFEVEHINGEDVSSEETTSSSGPARNLEEDLAKIKSEYLYLRAEFDNYRKNAIKERSQLIKFGTEPLIRELLDVVDNFDRALGAEVNESNVESFEQGMKMTASELKNVLQKFGVSEQDPTGQPFDPNLHEALSSEPTSEVQSGCVYTVFKKAYLLHDKLIRPAQVVVAREPEGCEDETEKIETTQK